VNIHCPILLQRPFVAAHIGLLLALLISLPLAASGQPAVPTTTYAGHAYVSIPDLATALDARIEYVPTKDKVILRSSSPTLVFTLLSSVYVMGEVQFRVPYPTRILNGHLHVSGEVLRELRLAPGANTETPVDTTVAFEPKTVTAPTGKALEHWAIRKIVIDPGHGGRDPGAVGPKRTYEKDITLAIARRLGEKLRKELGVEIVYTRNKDVFIGLGARARHARDTDGDLFVSLHCNAGVRRAAGGIEVYFLSEAKTAAAAEVAERENAALELETDLPNEGEQNTLRGIALEILSAQFLKESQDLAASIRGKMAKRFKRMDDRGVKQANFYVMRGTMGAMPSCLVEMGFISNPSEEKLLKTGRFQKDMADAIFEGIRTFKQANERQLSDTR
jgi:N-acetylmuramoyl-L-alanine amidase